MEYNNPLVKDRWSLRVVAHSNRAECYLRMKKWKPAQQDTERALEIDQFNEKALSRRRRARDAIISEQEEEDAREEAEEKKNGKKKKTEKTKKGEKGKDGKEEVDKYKGPTFWEVCEEQWPRTFGVLGKIWGFGRRYRGVVAAFYAVLTMYVVSKAWQTGLWGMFSPKKLTA